MYSIRYGTASMLVGAALMPVFAHAQSVTDLQNQINTLLSQLKTLQTQLWQAKASSSATTTPALGNKKELKRCLKMERNLSRGHRGEDVRLFQQFLASDPSFGFNGVPTGVFGPMTEKAMKKFQDKTGLSNAEEVRSFLRDGCDGVPGTVHTQKGSFIGTVSALTATSTFTVTNGSTTRTFVVNAPTTQVKVHTNATSTPTNGSLSDITVGKVVKVQGSVDANNVMTAREVHVFPAGTVLPIDTKGLHTGSLMKSFKKMFDEDEDDHRGRGRGRDDR